MRRALSIAALASALAACQDAAAPQESLPHGLDDASFTLPADASSDAPPADATLPDETPPETVFTLTPSSPTSSRSASFEFTADEPGCVFRCALDGAELAACTTPYTIVVGDGEHTLLVVALDAAGNADATPATHAWVVDSSAPETTITSRPPALDNSTSVEFEFTASEAGAHFECRLDDSAFAACSAPARFMALAEGAHRFEVRALDPVGNVDATPALYQWSIVTGTSDTTITSGPSGAVASTSASFSFTGTDAASFECRLDTSGFVACTTPRMFTGLGEGQHTFQVRARSAAGTVDPSPASRTWTVDVTPPSTTISSGPSGLVATTSAVFAFVASETSTLACSLDGAAFAPCPSPMAFNALAEGPHTFMVRATDAAGNLGATPAQRSWTVDTVAPDVTITSGPPGSHTVNYARFTFTASAGPASFECSLDGAAFAACASPLDLAGFSYATHTLRVRARDPAGNVDASPASYQWRSSPGLILYYQLNGDALNYSALGAAHDALASGVSFSPGMLGLAAFDGQISAPGTLRPLSNDTDYTLSFWFRNDSPIYEQVHRLFSFENPGQGGCSASVLDHNERGVLTLSCSGTGGFHSTVSFDFATGYPNWHHLALRHDGSAHGAGGGGDVSVFVDGAFLGALANPSRADVFSPQQAGNLVVGEPGHNLWFDEIRIYNRVYTPEEQCGELTRGIWNGQWCWLARYNFPKNIARGSDWSYWDRGGDPGPAWLARGFDDSAWPRGRGPLGYGETYLRSNVSAGPSAANHNITTYFRKTFVVSSPAYVSALLGDVMYDDGIVVYLNGVPIGRDSMPPGTITATTLAMGHEAGNAYQHYDWTAQKSLLVAGENTMAVEVHQDSQDPDDLVFDLALQVVLGSNGPWVPLAIDMPNILDRIWFTDAAHGWIIGGSSTLLRTTDGGETWQPKAAGRPGMNFLDLQFVDPLHGWIAGYENGRYPAWDVLLVTRDGGESWTVLDGVGAVSISFVSPTTGWIIGQLAGQDGTYRTTDGGTSWERLPIDYADQILFTDAANGWHTEFVDLYETGVFHSSDGGSTWTLQGRVGCCYSDLEAADPTTLWLIGAGSPHSYYGESKAVTRNGGATWASSPESSNGVALDATDFVDAEHGWAVGHGGSIIHTDDGGLSWSVQQVAIYDPMGPYGLSDEPEFIDVQFVDQNLGWALSPGLVLKTTSGGD